MGDKSPSVPLPPAGSCICPLLGAGIWRKAVKQGGGSGRPLGPASLTEADAERPIDHQGKWQEGEDSRENGTARPVAARGRKSPWR